MLGRPGGNMVHRLLSSAFLYLNSICVNAFLPLMLVTQGIFKVGPFQAIFGFFKTPKLPPFDEEEFLKKHGHNFKSGYITTKLNKVKIHYMETGDENGPLMICLHGFPEFWYSWKHIMTSFSDKYRVVAIDLRGYNKSSKPKNISDYHIHYLVNDVREVIEGLGYQQATVVGHDWGGLIAWYLSTYFPDVVRNLIILNAPNIRGFNDFLADHPWQNLTRFWYMSSFQLPRVASFYFTRYNYQFINTCFRGRPGIYNKKNRLSDEEILYYKHACASNIQYPIQLYSATNPYYTGLGIEEQAKITVQPTLVIWGMRDQVLDYRMVAYFKKYVTNCEVVEIDDASHWVALDQPEKTVAAMRNFLKDKPIY